MTGIVRYEQIGRTIGYGNNTEVGLNISKGENNDIFNKEDLQGCIVIEGYKHKLDSIRVG